MALSVLMHHACLATALGFTVVALVTQPAGAAVTEAWVQRYNSLANSHDSPKAVAVDSDGNVVVTGISFSGYPDYYTAKYAASDGALLWEKRYNGPGAFEDIPQGLAVDNIGNVLVTGSSYGEDSRSDYYTAKYAAANGAVLWEKHYNGPANSYDEARGLALDASGNVVVTGFSFNGTNNDCYTAKYAAADGALLWETRSNGGYNQVAVDGSGNVVVTGQSLTTNDLIGYYTVKYAAADGALLWEQRYHSSGTCGGPPGNCTEPPSAVAVDSGGNVVVTGNSATIKYLADGTGVWTNKPGAAALAVDGSGNVVVAGNSRNETNTSYADFYTAKYAAADGTVLWEKRGPGGVASAVAVDGNGNVLATGYSSRTNFIPDYYTAKYAAADGALLWEIRYNGGEAKGLAAGPNGMVAVTGSSVGKFGAGDTSDYATVVYRENLPPVSIALVPAGIRIRFTGIPGRNYNVERALTVNGPWSTLATPTAPLQGTIEYVDSNPPISGAFYRASEPTN